MPCATRYGADVSLRRESGALVLVGRFGNDEGGVITPQLLPASRLGGPASIHRRRHSGRRGKSSKSVQLSEVLPEVLDREQDRVRPCLQEACVLGERVTLCNEVGSHDQAT